MVAALSVRKELKAFIKGIPAGKLKNFPDSPRTIHHDDNFRLDMQKINNDGSHNLQIQANSGAKIKHIVKIAPRTVAGPVFAKDGKPTPENIRKEFLSKMLV